jgi:hypothetical protein
MRQHEQDINGERRMIPERGRFMVQRRSLAAVLAALMISSILFSGCTGQKGESQPPASTVTIPTTRPATPVPMATTPVLPGTTTIPFTPGPTPAWTPGTVAQGGAGILIRGDVTGLKSARGNFIDEIRFTVVKAPRAEPVTFEIPNTQIIFTKFGQQFGTNYLIIGRDNDNGDFILDDGESFDISVAIPPPDEIYPGQKFTMAIRTPQPKVTVTTEAPPVLGDSNILARAPA